MTHGSREDRDHENDRRDPEPYAYGAAHRATSNSLTTYQPDSLMSTLLDSAKQVRLRDRNYFGKRRSMGQPRCQAAIAFAESFRGLKIINKDGQDQQGTIYIQYFQRLILIQSIPVKYVLENTFGTKSPSTNPLRREYERKWHGQGRSRCGFVDGLLVQLAFFDAFPRFEIWQVESISYDQRVNKVIVIVVVVLLLVGVGLTVVLAGGGWYWYTHIRTPKATAIVSATTDSGAVRPNSAAPQPVTPVRVDSPPAGIPRQAITAPSSPRREARPNRARPDPEPTPDIDDIIADIEPDQVNLDRVAPSPEKQP